MKTVYWATAALVILMSGCHHHNVTPRCSGGCGPGLAGAATSGPAHVGQLPHGYFDPTTARPGPPTASYTYPYYTTRAPRDFLMGNPPSIGL